MLFPRFPPDMPVFIALLPRLLLLPESVVPLLVPSNLAVLPDSNNAPISFVFSHTGSNIKDGQRVDEMAVVNSIQTTVLVKKKAVLLDMKWRQVNVLINE